MTNNIIKVHDLGWVEFQDKMGDDLAIVNAARTSHLGESKGPEADKKLLLYLMKNHHDGPFEMAEMKFRIHAPELVWRQILRHRTGSYNLQSFRYTEAEEDQFFIPHSNEWRLQDAKNKQGSSGLLKTDIDGGDSTDGEILTWGLEGHIQQSMRLYQKALAAGVAKEIARLYIPAFALYSTGVVKFDVRNLMHFFQLRLHPHAQQETREFAEAMFTFFGKEFPWCLQAYLEYKDTSDGK